MSLLSHTDPSFISSYQWYLFVHQYTHHTFQTIPRQHRLLPPLKTGVFSNVPTVIPHDVTDLCGPHNKGQVCISAFIANKPLLAFQYMVKDIDDTFELI